MKPIFFIISFLWCNMLFSQVVTTEPTIPLADQSVKIIFDASQGSAGLKDFTGDVYAHTGVITNKSTSNSDWKYVLAGWSENTDKAKLSSLGNNKWQLEIKSSIREFYDVPAGEQILKLAFVFRSADGTKEGKNTGGTDIFVDVFQRGIGINIKSPSDGAFVELGSSVNIDIQTRETQSFSVFIDNELISTETDTLFDYVFTPQTEGNHWIIVVASGSSQTVSDTVRVIVVPTSNIADLPSNTLVDGINYIDDNTVTLVLYAPRKKNVHVIGDFNDWQVNQNYMMSVTPDKNRFWLTINNLEKGKEYVFQYLIDGNIRVADPYTDKISDPWNDSYIDDFTYPDLIPYPTDKTSDIASVLQTAQTPFDWGVENFEAPDKQNLVIYELHIRDFVETRHILTVLDSLDYLQNLGVNAIELMPINEFEGNDSWGYNPAFYFAPDKAYGTKNDYKKFIDECHKRGIAVIIDMVLNHSYGQSPFVRMYFDSTTGQPTADNPWYNQTCPHQPWCWGYDFNHQSEQTKTLVERINSYWLSEYKVDGFRFDFTKGFSNKVSDGQAYDANRIATLKRIADEIWAVNSDAYVIFEHLTDNSEEKELAAHGILLWGNMNSNYNEATMGYTENNKSDLSWAVYSNRGWAVPNLITYMESHDEERLMFKNLQYGNSSGNYNIKGLNIALSRVELATAFFLTLPGPKMIWQFGELGYDISIDDPCRVCVKPILWNYFDVPARRRLYSVYSAINELRRNNDVFNTTKLTMELKTALKSIVFDGNELDVAVLGNFSMAKQDVAANLTQTGTWYDYFSGASVEISDLSTKFQLNAGEYRILTSSQLTRPEFAPILTDVSFTGSNVIGSTLSVDYTFSDLNGDAEKSTVVTWYRSKNPDGTQLEQIEQGTTYTIKTDDNGYYIFVKMKPIADNDKNAEGLTELISVCKASNTSGIMEADENCIFVFPNPTSGDLQIRNCPENVSVSVCDLVGRPVLNSTQWQSNKNVVNVAGLESGMYFLILKQNNKIYKCVKFYKN